MRSFFRTSIYRAALAWGFAAALTPACADREAPSRDEQPAPKGRDNSTESDASRPETTSGDSSPKMSTDVDASNGSSLDGAGGGRPDAGSAEPDAGAAGASRDGKDGKLPIHFVGLASGTKLVAKTRPFAYDDYPSCDAEVNEGGEPIITECVARAIVDDLNDELEALAGVRLFTFGAFEVRPYSLQAEMKAPASGAEVPRDFWNAEFVHPDALTIVMPEVVDSTFMCTNEAIFADPGLWFAAPAGARKGQMLYGLARMIGLHDGLSAGDRYEGCGGFDYPEPSSDPCACEYHPSRPIYPQDATCPVCEPEPTLDTPTYGALSRHAAKCWLTQLHRCSFGLNPWSDRIQCSGADGDVTCSCPVARPTDEPLTFTVSSCATTAEDERLSKAKEVCGVRSCRYPDDEAIVCEGFATENSLPCACPSGHVFYHVGDACSVIESAEPDPTRCELPYEECIDPFGHDDTVLDCFEFQAELRCICPETSGGTYFIVDSCDLSERASRLAQAEEVCGVNTCEIPGRPDVDCIGLGTESSVDCRCPGGELFRLPVDCTGADFTQAIDQICGPR